MSLSARRAWIEMTSLCQAQMNLCVALRKESVDRNSKMSGKTISRAVALRKESVDRNDLDPELNSTRIEVALRKESVDRNT